MLNKLRLGSFKAFDELSVDLRPITVLVGPNNSGKSSVMSAIRLLSQTIESKDNDIDLLLNGSFGDFGTYRDVVYKNDTSRNVNLGISGTYDLDLSIMEEELKGKRYGIDLSFGYRPKRKEVVMDSRKIYKEGNCVLKTRYYDRKDKQHITEVGQQKVRPGIKHHVSEMLREWNFIPSIAYMRREMEDDSAVANFMSGEVESAANDVTRVQSGIRNELRSVEYVGAMRQPPSRTYLFTGEKRRRVGPKGENAISILAMDARRGGSKSKDITRQVGEWLQKAGMASDINIQDISDRHYELRIEHPDTSESQNFADTGYGHSQIIPVLVAGFNLHEGGTLMVEQPEIHLHPSAQAELGDFFLDAYNSGKYSIIETHSEYMILRLQQHVANGNIDPSDIVFHYVYPNEGKKAVQRMGLSSDAKFKSEWPEGFFPQRLDEAKKLSISRS